MYKTDSNISFNLADSQIVDNSTTENALYTFICVGVLATLLLIYYKGNS